MSHVTHINASCHTHESVKSLMLTLRVTREQIMSHVLMRRVTHAGGFNFEITAH